jgi:hypothetical protein
MDGRPRITTQSREVDIITRARQNALETAWIVARGAKHHITERFHDGEWAGEPCFILGGGYSLTGFDFERLRGRRTIAVNRAFEWAPFAEILFSMDFDYYKWCLKHKAAAFLGFTGARVFLDSMNSPFGGEIYYIRKVGIEGFPASLKTGIYTANNSGYGALQIALCLGANPIYLLGFDMHNDGPPHFHDGYKDKYSVRPNATFKRGFEALAPALAKRGIRVVNLNPTSALRCFEFQTIEEALHDNNQGTADAGQTAAQEPTAGADGGSAAPAPSFGEMSEGRIGDVPQEGALLAGQGGIQDGGQMPEMRIDDRD